MLWLLLLFPLSLMAAQTNLSSDLPIEFDGNSNSLVARQNATFVHDELTVTADEIRFSKDNNIAVAEGNARITFHGGRVVSTKIVYDVQNESFSCEDFRAGIYPYMIKGKSIEGDNKAVTIRNSTLYTSQTGKFVPNISVARARLNFDGDKTGVKIDRAIAKIGPIPVLPIPVAAFSLNDDRNISVELEAGNSDTDGTFLRSATLYPITSNIDAGLNLDYYSKRGWLYGPKAEIKGETFSSSLSSGYISDRGERGSDLLNNPIDQDRGWVSWQHLQDIGKNIHIANQTQYWSDSEVLRDFRPRDYTTQQAPTSFTEVAYTPWGWNISAFSSYELNNFDVADQVTKLPEIRVDKLSAPIGNTGLYYSWLNSASWLEKGTLSHRRIDSLLRVQYPTKLADNWSIVPIASARYTQYDSLQNSDESLGRLIGEIGLDSKWTFNRIWEVKNDTWKIDGLKHLMEPIVQYRYIPSADTHNDEIKQIEDDVFYTGLPTIDSYNATELDELYERHFVRFGLRNTLQTRDTDPNASSPTRNLLRLDLYQDFNFTTTDTAGKDWGDFYVLASAYPASWLETGAFFRLNWEEMGWLEHRYFLSVHDADYRRATLYTRYLKGDTEQYGLEAMQRLTDRLSLYGEVVWDVRTSDLSELHYGVRQRMRSGWEVIYGFTRRDNDSRDSKTQFRIAFKWAAF